MFFVSRRRLCQLFSCKRCAVFMCAIWNPENNYGSFYITKDYEASCNVDMIGIVTKNVIGPEDI